MAPALQQEAYAKRNHQRADMTDPSQRQEAWRNQQAETASPESPAPQSPASSQAAPVPIGEQLRALAIQPLRAPILYAPDDALQLALADPLSRYTLGTLIDAAWETDKQLTRAQLAKQSA